jgi:hypothetical protein
MVFSAPKALRISIPIQKESKYRAKPPWLSLMDITLEKPKSNLL